MPVPIANDIFGMAVGVIACAAGIFVIVKRDAVARFNARNIRGMFGKAGERTARSPSPQTMRLVGIGWTFIGVLIITAGIFGALKR